MIWATSLLAITGAVISYLIYRSKVTGQPLVCAIGQDCNKVIGSKYNHTLGFPNEILGLIYFLFIFVLSASGYFGLPSLWGLPWPIVMTIISLPSALFSTYLIWVQIKILRELCEYCLVVAGANIGIFAIQLIGLLS